MKNHLLHISLFIALFVAIALNSHAVPVTQEQARQAVQKYLSLTPAPMNANIGWGLGQTRTFNRENHDTPLFHVMALQGGGFIVTSADTSVSPIIAISESDDFVESDDNPLWKLLTRDLPQRMDAQGGTMTYGLLAAPESAAEQQWANLLAPIIPSIAGISSISDVRIAQMVQSEWDQSRARNLITTLYNYYTPERYACGCVATAGAQIMRYYQYPTSYVTPKTYWCSTNDVSTQLAMKGGVYDWTNMPLTPGILPSSTQREAIGRLTYDVGVASEMNYSSSGSGAQSWFMAHRLRETFGYASSASYQLSSTTSYPAANPNIRNALLATLDAGMPAVLSIRTSDSGHSVIADGYGYQSNVLYLHLNMGWGGSQNAWYNFEVFNVSTHNFTLFNNVSYNIHPTNVGEYLTGRTLNSTGSPLSGSTVTASNTTTHATYTTNSNAKGMYVIRVPSSSATYALSAVNSTLKTTSSVTIPVQPSTSWATVSSYATQAVGNSWGNDLTLIKPLLTTVYVNISRLNDNDDGSTWVQAKKNIQAGVEAVAPGGTVIVADGTYQPISTANKAVTVQSLNGPGVTFINGGNTSRCATLGGNGQSSTTLCGFTLTNGLSYSASGGGAQGGTLNDCVISGNTATYGGGTAYSTLNRCLITGNTASSYDGGGIYNSTANNCVIYRNTANRHAGGADSSTLNNCTVWGNQAAYGGGGVGGQYGSTCTINNSIVWGNTAGDGAHNYYASKSTFANSCTTPNPGGTNIGNDPRLMNAASGNFRLLANSPCVAAGNNALVVGSIDCDGNPRVKNGAVSMGAYEFQSNTITIAQPPPVPVPIDWLTLYRPKGLGLEDLAHLQGANGYSLWESYVAGLTPTDPTSRFLVTNFVAKTDNRGTTLKWTPHRTDRNYTVWGKTNLTDKSWHTPTNNASRFFKVIVEM